MKIRQSESRILIFLNQVEAPHRFTRNISTKLKIDYGYLLRILKEMKDKDWLESHRRENKTFYAIKPNAPLNQAKESLEQQNEVKHNGI